MMGDLQMQRISSNVEKGLMAQRKAHILEKLTVESVQMQKLILFGEVGVGKTWMAREISKLAKKKQKVDVVIWLPPNINKYNNSALLNSIRSQLSLSASSNLKDDYHDLELNNDSPKRLKEKIMTELAEKKLLLVLDDVKNNIVEGNGEISKDVANDINVLIGEVKSSLNLNEKNIKVLITMRCSDPPKFPEIPDQNLFKVEPMHVQDAIKLLDFLLIRREERNMSEDIAKSIVEKTRFLPSAIILMAKILNSFSVYDAEEEWLNNLTTKCETSYLLTELLRNGYNPVPASVLIDCCWEGNHFFRDRQSVHYNELIAHWMLEGYLGPIDFMEKTYERGHHILMELMDCQILKKVEPQHVAMVKVKIDLDQIVPRGSTISLGNNWLGGYGGTANLGLASIFQIGEWEGFGIISEEYGTMITVGMSKKGQHKGSVLLVDGNCIDRAASGDLLFHSLLDLKVLGFINPTYTSWPPSSLTGMPKLHILVMRGCDFLHNINLDLNFVSLTALEISGATSLTNLADSLFARMPNVRSINFSGMQIRKLPSTLYGLDKLSWLILRNCSKLEQLDSLKTLRNLMVLDLCGASSLRKLTDKNFTQNTKIQTLNLSGTKIRTIPLLYPLKGLTHLLLKGCLVLGRLCGIGLVSSLQILDLSMSTGFKEFHDQSLDGLKDLKVLDLSETSVKRVPDHISNLQHVNLKGCKDLGSIACLKNAKGIEILDLSQTVFPNLQSISDLHNIRQLVLSRCLLLQELPDLNKFAKLEVLDLSGCTVLTMIPVNSFLSMPKLQKLDLSKTSIKQLPLISHLINLLYLSLGGCTTLGSLSEQNTSVEMISDLSSNSTGMVANFLEKMSSLQYLNLSETKLKLPSAMLNITDLRQLYLRGCKDIFEVPNLENFSKLEILDLSGCGISQLPSLKNLSKLRQLLLGDCFSLPEFQVEIDHLLGMGISNLPYDIPTLTQLELLVLPSKNNTAIASSSQAEVPNQCDWIISVLPVKIREGHELFSFNGCRFAQLLETDPTLWKEMHLSATPLMEPYESNVLSFKNDHYAFIDIYFKIRHFDDDSSKTKSLEIRGFQSLPQEMKRVLQFAEFVFLIDNTFQPQLSDFQNMKGCWIERCKNIDQLFNSDDGNPTSKLEVLSVSNTSDLERICSVPVLPKFIENLTHLYLESCPDLTTVFSTCPPPVNLKVLQIKFCDTLESILGQPSEETEFLNLETLHLWELPMLERIGGKLPSIKSQIIEMCPNLRRNSEASDQVIP